MKVVCIIIVFCSSVGLLLGQDYSPRTQDAELWTSFSLKKDITKKLDISLDGAYRLQNNYQDFKSTFIQFNADYELLKPVGIGSSYRYVVRPDSGYEHIWMLKAKYEYRLKPFDLATRFRYDFRVDEKESTRQIYRQKVEIKYKRKKHFYRPFVFYEFFYLNKYDFQNSDRYRFGGGSDFEINKRSSIELSFFIQGDKNQANPEDAYVLSLGFSYDL